MNKWIILFLSLFLLTGCWDKIELEDRGFAVSLGIDKKDDGYSVTVAIPNTAALAEKGGEDKARAIKSADGGTIAEALRKVDIATRQSMYYGQLKMTVLGEDIMKDEKLFREAIDAMERNRDINRKMIVLAAKGKASKILEADIPGEPMVGMYVYNYYRTNANQTGVTFRQDLKNTITELRSAGSTIIPVINTDKKEIALSGSAVINDFKLAGYLDDKETRGYMWLNGGCNAVINIDYKNILIPIQINHSRSRIAFYEDDGGIVCDASVHTKGTVAEYNLTGQSFTDQKLQEMSAILETKLEEEILVSIKKLQEELSADGYNLLDILRKRDYHLFLQVVEDWENEYKNMKIIPSVHADITGTGALR